MKTSVCSLVFRGSKVKNNDIKLGAAAQKSQIIIFIQKSLIMKMLSLFFKCGQRPRLWMLLVVLNRKLSEVFFSYILHSILKQLYLLSYSSVDNFPISKADLEYFVFLLLKHQFQSLLPERRGIVAIQTVQCRQFTFPNQQR